MENAARYVLCIENRGYAAALEVRKVYRALPDLTAENRGLIRVIDESGEDYLYPADCFVAIEVPGRAEAVFSQD